MPAETNDPELAALAQALATLAPAGRISRDQLIFRAGAASARRHVWLWPAATAAFAALAASVVGSALLSRAPQPVYHVVYVHDQAPELTDSGEAGELPRRWQAQARYLEFQQEVVQKGLDALPALPPPLDKPANLEQILSPL
jgi:hypothetical protein